ncbi:hypothetical protein T10_10311 [Trichinella papuae]|uniref:Uncharacterized protein n=1 Tax=Trichinella papuae TaxID=268474 RepID=A0A0V1M3C4_9BILA|nr:hypothetical protein T10_10311 [Trichinella papuae]
MTLDCTRSEHICLLWGVGRRHQAGEKRARLFGEHGTVQYEKGWCCWRIKSTAQGKSVRSLLQDGSKSVHGCWVIKGTGLCKKFAKLVGGKRHRDKEKGTYPEWSTAQFSPMRCVFQSTFSQTSLVQSSCLFLSRTASLSRFISHFKRLYTVLLTTVVPQSVCHTPVDPGRCGHPNIMGGHSTGRGYRKASKNDSITEKKRTLLVRENYSAPDINRAQFLGKYCSRTDKKWKSWLWENSTNKEKDEAEFFEGKGLRKNGGAVPRKTALGQTKSVISSWLENGTAPANNGRKNDSAADLNRPEFLGKYGNRPDKKWQSWLWENSTNQEKDETGPQNGVQKGYQSHKYDLGDTLVHDLQFIPACCFQLNHVFQDVPQGLRVPHDFFICQGYRRLSVHKFVAPHTTHRALHSQGFNLRDMTTTGKVRSVLLTLAVRSSRVEE